MNEKTAELRDIFTSVTDEETVTESQEDTRGSLETDERTVEERVGGVIRRMRDRYDFETELSTRELTEVVTAFYDGVSDEAIAAELDVDEATIFDARLALHLVSEENADGIDLVEIRNGELDDAKLAEKFDVPASRIERYRRVAAARDESRAANDRYREEFDSLLADADIVERMATDVREDGLEDATEGMETDVSF